MNIKEITADIVAAIKEQHKQLSEKRPAIFLEADIWRSVKNGKECYSIDIANKTYASDTDDHSEIRNFCKAVEEAVKELSKLRGYLVAAHYTEFSYQVRDYVWRGYTTRTEKLATGLVLYIAPCKEFVSLAKWIGKFSSVKVEALSLYTVGIGGKRGRIYGEESHRDYLCHDSKKCRRILDWIIKNKSSRDTLKVETKVTDDIDKFDLEVSIRHETEFEGTRHSHLEMTVTTPTGKVKQTLNTMFI